jgi:hypothetical protein
MKEKEVIKVSDDFYVVRPAKLMAIFSLFTNAIKRNHFPLQKRMTVAGKNSDFDLRFLKRINPEFGQFFYSRKLDPGGLWVMESDDKPPDTKTCAERMRQVFPGMPEAVQHKAMDDNRLVTWLMRGGFRRLGMYGGKHAPPQADAKGHEWTDRANYRANSGGIFPLVCSRCGVFSGTDKAGNPCELGKDVSF